ncbi:hypothetical protein Q5P01_000446 [Channa striata]|uniref:Uncharacterized protein n=1 Tax=Channa striata TaxID=64152 RepID=A0AA88IC17_CHASR|nr:hypothetical protein Q5P01_000446 [Channa striata]
MSLRAACFRRPVLVLGGTGLIVFVGLFLKTVQDRAAGTGKEVDTPGLSRGLSDLDSSLKALNNIVRVFEKKQDAIQKMLEDDRNGKGKAAEGQKSPVQKEPEQNEKPDTEIQDGKEVPKEKNNKIFPKSPLFKEWGSNLSEDDQREAQALYEKYGYNVFLSDRLPIDRPLPDTRDPRCLKKTYPKDLPSLGVVLIYLNEALSILKRALRSIIDRTPKIY